MTKVQALRAADLEHEELRDGLRVADAPLRGNIDPANADDIEQQSDGEGSDTPAGGAGMQVGQLILRTGQTLKRVAETARQMMTAREAEKAQAHADYEKTETAARELRDHRLAAAEADLHQIRYTIEAIEPARAKLAERV